VEVCARAGVSVGCGFGGLVGVIEIVQSTSCLAEMTVVEGI
jgi:hypothetical protein